MFRSFLATGSLFTFVLCMGCTQPPKGAAPAVQVTGTVKMDGKAVPTGEINFTVDGFPPRILEIKDGAFAGEAGIGKNQVEVFIFVESAPMPKYGGQRLKTNTTSEKYWGPNTILDAKVEAGAANEFKFDLVSK